MTLPTGLRAAVLVAILTLASTPAAALEFDRQLLLRIDGPSQGQAFAFRRGTSCVALSAWHVVASPNEQVSMADGLGTKVDGEIGVEWKDIDVALIRILRGGTAPCPAPPDPADIDKALRSPVGLVLVVSNTDTLVRIAVTVETAGPELLSLKPVHPEEAAYAGISGAVVLFDHTPVGVVVRAEGGRFRVVPLDAIAKRAPETFSATFNSGLRYDTSRLPAEIRTVAIQARQSRLKAEASAEQAVVQADRAVQVADRADQGDQAGLASFTADDKSSRYRGEVKNKGKVRQASGYGVKELITPEFLGLTIEGILIDGRFTGPGRIKYSANTYEVYGDSKLYVGQLDNHMRSGFGILTGSEGQKWFGAWKDNASDGPTTIVFKNGARLEVMYVKGKPSGLGVEWDPEGRLVRCGYWADGKYSRPAQGCPGYGAVR